MLWSREAVAARSGTQCCAPFGERKCEEVATATLLLRMRDGGMKQGCMSSKIFVGPR